VTHLQPKKHRDKFTPNVRMDWGKINDACALTGFSRSTILRIVGDPANKIRTYLLKTRPDSQTGARLINLPDLVAYFNRQAEAAQVAASELEGTAAK
jgi:hypothetical protein